MPILQNAKKALRSSKRKFGINARIKSQMKTAVDTVRATMSPENLSEAFSKIDRAVKRGLVHKNKAARLKSRAAKSAATGVTPVKAKVSKATPKSKAKAIKAKAVAAKKTK